MRLATLKRRFASAWDKTGSVRRLLNSVLAIIGAISVLTAFFPFISVWFGRTEMALHMIEDEGGNAVVPEWTSDFGFSIGTKNMQHEVILQEVKVEYSTDDIEFRNNDIFHEIGISSRNWTWISWKGERVLQPNSFCVFAAPYSISSRFTNTTAIVITAKAVVPQSELSFPWNLFAPPVQKTTFPVTLNRKPKSGQKVGIVLGPLEGLEFFGSTATNQISMWTKQGTAEVRVLAVAKDKGNSNADDLSDKSK